MTIMRMLLCCGALWTATAAAPLCAQIRIVPRAKLDSLAHPATANGADAMRFERTLIDAGHIGEDDAPSAYTFRWRNTGGTPLVVTRVRTTCGCAVAAWDKKPVAQGGEGSVTVTYHPKGHPGVFDRRIFVYTQLSDKEPTAILNLRGTVTASERTDDDYPYAMGALRLKQRTVRLSDTLRGQTERIECLNTGDKPLTPVCEEGFEATGLSFACEPATLAPGAKGDLIVRFDPAKAAQPLRRTPLLIRGPDVPPRERMLWIEFPEKE